MKINKLVNRFSNYKKEEGRTVNLIFFNDTRRLVRIHPATINHGCKVINEPIKHLEERIFELPEGTHAWVKMWDNDELGLTILVSPVIESN